MSYADSNNDGSVDENEIKEENNYYPFGLKHKGYNSGIVGRNHKYKYQGQELEKGLGYNMYEFELRHYDASIGRFVTTDPYEQFDSPYLAMGNNPVVSFDPDGGYCLDANGNQIACPQGEDVGDFYDDYKDSETNHITVLDEAGGTAEGSTSGSRLQDASNYDYSQSHDVRGSKKVNEDIDFIVRGKAPVGIPDEPWFRFLTILVRDAEADPGATDDAITAVTAITPVRKGGGATISARQLVKRALLPQKGLIRFIPRAADIKIGKLLTKNGGFVDKFGNIWKKGPSRTAGEAFEWDVQLSAKGKAQLGHLSRDGKHLNVSLEGKITH